MYFGKSGNQLNILHSPTNILCTLSNILRTLSKILRTLSKIIRTISNILGILPHTQVGLPLYLANMFKATKASSRELQEQLENNSTPNRFPKVLPTKKILEMSCPSWQWHRTGSRWSPVRTLLVAPLWCDLGYVPNSRGNKAAANICLFCPRVGALAVHGPQPANPACLIMHFGSK